MIKALVTAYPDGIRCGCEDGLLPLHRYLHRPIVDLDALQLLLTYYPDAQLARSNRGQTPLHVAAANNAVRCAEYLVPLLTNVNVSDRAGRTSLHHAAFNGHKEVGKSY